MTAKVGMEHKTSWRSFVEKNPSWPNVGVYYRGNSLRPACAEACLYSTSVDELPDAKAVWWINRVLVPESLRGQGIGRELLQRLKALVVEQGGDALIVTPSGYDTPQVDQIAFYRACGFDVLREEGIEALMVWRPE